MEQLCDPIAAMHRGQGGICTKDLQLWSPPRPLRDPQTPMGHRGAQLERGNCDFQPTLPFGFRMKLHQRGSTWCPSSAWGGSYLVTEPCPLLPPSPVLPACRGRQSTTDTPTPGEFPTLVSYFKGALQMRFGRH